MSDSANHTRVNNILLGYLERPTLRWLAVHTPRWMNPDMYTVIGVAGSLITFVGYILSRFAPGWFWLATIGFVVNWYGDSLDGTLARHRHIERPIYGFFIDHVTDAISQVLIFIGLGLSPYVTFDVACLTLVGYILLSLLVYIRTTVAGEYKISYGMLGPTEARVLAMLLNTAMFFFGFQNWPVSLGFLGNVIINPYDVIVGFIGALLFYFFISTAWQEGVRLGREGR